MFKAFFKLIVPKNTRVFNIAFKIYDYKYWYPKIWAFDVLKTFAVQMDQVKFIQIGSNNGITGDPIYPYIKQYQWNGVLVEPVSYLFEQLKNNYKPYKSRLNFENSAIAIQNGQLKFYRLNKSNLPGLPDWYDQLGSFNKEVIMRHRDIIPYFDHLLMEDIVNAISFDTLLQKFAIQNTDLIHIDTEGYDFEILKLIPFCRLGVKLVMFEHIHLKNSDYQKALLLLKQNGFYCGRLQTDTIAIQKTILQTLKPSKKIKSNSDSEFHE